MKKLSIVFLVVVSFLFTPKISFAQCPGCVITTSCHPVGGGLCPDSLPAGTQGAAYSQDITCYLPTELDAGPFSGGVLGIVPLESMHIDAISGLPFGLNWTSDHAGNNFFPSSGDTLGCVKVCGVPISVAGVYNVVVSVTAGVYAGSILGTQYGQTTFDFQMVLLASTSGNIAYNFTPSSACDTGTFAFTPNISFGLPQVTNYSWNFGGGNTSTATNPTFNFSTPGDYPVTLTTTVYDLALTSANAVASNYWWCGDIEEPTLPFVGCTAAPDLFFKFTHGADTYTSSTGNNNASQTWSGIVEPLTSSSIALQIIDYDPTSANDDGGIYVTTVTGTGVYGYNTSSPFGGGCSGSFTIGLSVDTVITVTDTIHVYASPGIPTIASSVTDFCPGDSALLTVTTPDNAGYNYEWYLNDTTLVNTTTTNEMYVYVGGDYSVKIYNLNSGCYNQSANVTVVENAAIPLGYAIAWNTPNARLQSNLGASYSYQWQTWNGTAWVNVSAPEGAQYYYTPIANGELQLIASNASGCSDTAFYTFNTFGVEDQNYISQVSVYPNPTTHSFMLDLKDVKSDNISVSIVNLVGQTLYNKDFKVSDGNFKYNFDVNEFANGIYTIDIKVGNFVIRKKLIKD